MQAYLWFPEFPKVEWEVEPLAVKIGKQTPSLQRAATGPTNLPDVLLLLCSFLSSLSTHPNRSRQMAVHPETGSAGGFFR
ncbi:hypothetical protein EXN66_Car001360 [Channa argus]|uniref:Uncharacterized protein n=1 Tax=Channa argus TaxID=215402 RepID=A0A6G1R1D8_CHAAH|nr:hypothetical protein EXN66_Car001360 [Channa argus]